MRTFDNSPAIYRWESMVIMNPVRGADGWTAFCTEPRAVAGGCQGSNQEDAPNRESNAGIWSLPLPLL